MEKPAHSLPDRICGADLDECLRLGWYRMGQQIFSVDYIFFEGEWVRVFWLRFVTARYQARSSHHRIQRLGSDFSVAHAPIQLTAEHEALYRLYRKHIDFDASPTAGSFLYSNREQGKGELFDSQMIEVRHDGKLVAMGVYDLGKESIAGILNFYHPDYAKMSLGKFLMLEKMRFCLQSGIPFYYPGYIAIQNPKFDYKTFPGEAACEYYEPFSQTWLPYNRPEMNRLTEEQSIYFGPVTRQTDFMTD